MYVVKLDDHSGAVFGPFESDDSAKEYLAQAGGEGKIIHLIKPWSLTLRVRINHARNSDW